jgi:antitoxin ParD1/3/4
LHDLDIIPGRVIAPGADEMNVSLTPELEKFVTNKVESGLYQTASEVIREGLRLLRERDELHQKKLEELRKEIAIGIDQADRGKVAPLNAKETLAEVRKKR